MILWEDSRAMLPAPLSSSRIATLKVIIERSAAASQDYQADNGFRQVISPNCKFYQDIKSGPFLKLCPQVFSFFFDMVVLLWTCQAGVD